jgi:thiosulfate reductase cytochrome b subunit
MLGLALTGLKIHFGAREREILTFEEAFNIHNLLGVALLPVTAWFFLRAFRTGDFRQYLGKPEDGVGGILRQVRYYLVGVFRGEGHPYHSSPQRRFNPLQQVTYASIMYTLVPTIAVSGVLLLYPEVLPKELAGRTGAFWVSLLHYVSGCGAIAFLLGHLYLATTGDRVSYNFTAMWNGRHRYHVPKGGHGASSPSANQGPPPTKS